MCRPHELKESSNTKSISIVNGFLLSMFFVLKGLWLQNLRGFENLTGLKNNQ
jgi:hypothetical protein